MMSSDVVMMELGPGHGAEVRMGARSGAGPGKWK